MPDHVHALIAFPSAETMSRVIGEWKHFHARYTGIAWQEGYFDHRIRHGAELDEKIAYIRKNPVVKNMCDRDDAWPWFCEPGMEDANSRAAARPAHLYTIGEITQRR